ncbi:MAG: sensor histidine kinase [Clostridiaceae bacterium]|jgi:two-component system sensor histidine kinase YesM|nr:sensor histidine kinase [Clostridiaceae bacterium]
MPGFIRRRTANWNLDRRINAFVTSLIYCITMITLIVFVAFYFYSFVEQSNNIIENQLSTLAKNYEYTFDSYKNLAESLIIDDAIQYYVLSNGKTDKSFFDLFNNATNTLQNTVNMHSEIRYVSVVSYNFDHILYKGYGSYFPKYFPIVYMDDYANSIYCRNPGTLRMSFNDAYNKNGNKMLNIYMPIYSLSKMINEIGLLCIILDGSLFDGLSEENMMEYDSEVILIDINNYIMSCSDKSLVGSTFEHANQLTGSSGNFKLGSNLYNYMKIGKWNYYLISRVPLANMYKGTITMTIILAVLSVLMANFGLIICRMIINRAYKPLDTVIQGMNSAAEGKLDTRINMENVGIDFVKLANGFNYMMGRITTLMEQVKLEQQQMDQLRFNALQSQIQPHFLYNTLECIHWQASADGNEEVSILVRALARFYRLCLSDGKDVIHIEQEVDHARNYLIIQNMRYDNIISSTIEMDEDCKKFLIPKITLQPLIENSIYHGMKVKEGRKGELRITIRREDDEVIIVIADNGTGMSENQIKKMNDSISNYDKDFGYGIRNVNKRIEILFGKAYGLHFERNNTGGVTVTIRLPARVVSEYEEVL